MTKPSRVLLSILVLALIFSCNFTRIGASSTAAFAFDGAFDAHVKVVAAATAGDAAHGKTLYAASCAGCHGATGTEGGAGPSLKGEKSKKNQAAAVAWIKNPTAPMPKLYPSPLNEKDVSDVAAYVETL